ncbi:unnamed protein product [Parascedosporium putredinis]|uniref:Uncharacterized protein n=1 Tax=Parascedosporium putredinis TaxID=1442378 RepID=A0A9P1HBH5_9PEZI|nr:unnamed protein product [Parascedosporium putredinis]CAI8002810.1 unnamed protein product [Parascedosporium putredinis]
MATQADELVEVEPPRPAHHAENNPTEASALEEQTLYDAAPSFNRTDSNILAGGNTGNGDELPNAGPDYMALPRLAPGRRPRAGGIDRRRPTFAYLPNALHYVAALTAGLRETGPPPRLPMPNLHHLMNNNNNFDPHPINRFHLDYQRTAFGTPQAPPAPAPSPLRWKCLLPARASRETREKTWLSSARRATRSSNMTRRAVKRTRERSARNEPKANTIFGPSKLAAMFTAKIVSRADDRRQKQSRFQAADGSSNLTPQSKVFCAVDDCHSDVTNKGAWVGIYL